MRDLTCHILIEKAEDLPDCWTGHCLDLDIVSQGHSVGDAIDMALEATMLFISDGDLLTSDEIEARRAPEEYWEAYTRVSKMLASGNRSDAFFCATASVRLAETAEEQEVLRAEIDELLKDRSDDESIDLPEVE